jgi:hypothetical protein
MLDRLERIPNRTAYLLAAAGLAISLAAAFMAPQDVELGAWVRLVIWHGMLKWACIVGIFGMGVLAIVYLARGRDRLFEWGRAMQVALLPLWVVAVIIGVISAYLVWNALNLTERRMIMSVGYTVVAAVALMLSLFWENRRVGAVGQILTSLAMAAGLAWIEFAPKGDDVHPSGAVFASPNIAFRVYALVMMAGCLIAVLALTVPVRRWLQRSEAEAALEH